MKNIPCILIAAVVLCTRLSAQSTDESAFTPANPPEMKPFANHDTPAYRAAKLFRHGANLGNYLEVPPGQNWGGTFSADELVAMKREGFDHVRVPVGWHHYAGPAPDFKLSPGIFACVDLVVTNALNNQLAVMINIHHFDELDKGPVATTEAFLKIWQQVAEHYKNFPEPLAFELDNEPHDAATTVAMNPIYTQVIAEIRQTNPHRTIFVEPGKWGGIGELKNLVLPPDDNIIVSVHCYDPFYFTHQGATWAGPDTKQTGIVFPGPPIQPLVSDPKLDLKPWVRNWIKNYNTLPTEKNPSGPLAFTGKLKYIRAWSDYYGRPVHLGEFGAYTKADAQSRRNFYSAVRHAAEEFKIGWCIWDWNAGFCYWDKKERHAVPGMHDALFGP